MILANLGQGRLCNRRFVCKRFSSTCDRGIFFRSNNPLRCSAKLLHLSQKAFNLSPAYAGITENKGDVGGGIVDCVVCASSGTTVHDDGDGLSGHTLKSPANPCSKRETSQMPSPFTHVVLAASF